MKDKRLKNRLYMQLYRFFRQLEVLGLVIIEEVDGLLWIRPTVHLIV